MTSCLGLPFSTKKLLHARAARGSLNIASKSPAKSGVLTETGITGASLFQDSAIPMLAF